MILKENQDAFGQELFDYLNLKEAGKGNSGVVERWDGYIGNSDPISVYFGDHKDFFPVEKKAIRFARGKVLDVGSGAGRHALYLQSKGLEVTGLDNSALALEVCRRRGLKKTVLMPFSKIDSGIGIFDTVMMLGNNFGLFGSYNGAKRLLKKLYRITSKKGRIIATTSDIYRTDNPDHLAYQEYNRQHGRMSGQIKMRTRYHKMISPWFDYLMVSKKEMEDILEGTGWKAVKYIDSDGSAYAVILEKEKK